MEIQIKQIQAELLSLEITETITQSEPSIEPTPEVERITDHIDQRFNRLEAKIDQLIGQKG